MVQIFNTILETAFDSNGNPISGAQLFIYEAGTTTKLTTFSDSALTVANANPLIADSAGRFVTIYGSSDDYKFVLAPATDTDPPTSPIKTTDDYVISAATSFSGGISSSGETEHLINEQTGTSYTILDGDRAKLVTHSNGSSIAVGLPQAGAGSAFEAGWYYETFNKGAGLVTITPTTSTINGLATLELPSNSGCKIYSDGTNYQIRGISKIEPSVNAQTGTTYTIVTGDLERNVTLSNSGTVAVTLPQANTTTFKSGWWTEVENVGAGMVTVTPSTSTIAGGASTIVLTRGQKAKITSDGTNYNAVIDGKPVGDVSFGYSATPHYGHLLENGDTLGSASSGATRASAIFEALFHWYWNNIADGSAPVSSGRGASAVADFAANKTITMPDNDKRVPYGAGTSTTGETNGAATVAAAGSITINAVTLVTANLPAHTHNYSTGEGGQGGAEHASAQAATTSAKIEPTTSTGSGSSFTPTGSFSGSATSVDQLGRVIYWYIKY